MHLQAEQLHSSIGFDWWPTLRPAHSMSTLRIRNGASFSHSPACIAPPLNPYRPPSVLPVQRPAHGECRVSGYPRRSLKPCRPLRFFPSKGTPCADACTFQLHASCLMPVIQNSTHPPLGD